jgi:prevent-host-death family protein
MTRVPDGKRRRQGSAGGSVSVTATEAQNNFGRVLGNVAQDRVVYITRYDRPEAVVLSVERYEALSGSTAPDLQELTHRFDELLAGMQSAESAAAVDAFFRMQANELGEAAVSGARDDPA